eukprot:scaffold1697_cov180-Amphora_coffeaeformis.AAC.17
MDDYKDPQRERAHKRIPTHRRSCVCRWYGRGFGTLLVQSDVWIWLRQENEKVLMTLLAVSCAASYGNYHTIHKDVRRERDRLLIRRVALAGVRHRASVSLSAHTVQNKCKYGQASSTGLKWRCQREWPEYSERVPFYPNSKGGADDRANVGSTSHPVLRKPFVCH